MMESMQSIKLILTWFCIYPPTPDTNEAQRMLFIVFSAFNFAANLFGMIDGAIFVYRFINTDFSGSLYAILQVAALLKGTYLIVAAHYVRLQLVAVIQTLSRNYEQSNFF